MPIAMGMGMAHYETALKGVQTMCSFDQSFLCIHHPACKYDYPFFARHHLIHAGVKRIDDAPVDAPIIAQRYYRNMREM